MPDLLSLYDTHLRGEAEMAGAVSVVRSGPLWVCRFEGGALFVSYRELDDAAEAVSRVKAMLDEDDTVVEAEWKTRSHDSTPGLTDALTAAGFSAQAAESVMIGEAEALAGVEPPHGVTVHLLTEPTQMRAALEMQDAVFGGSRRADRMLAELLDRRRRGEPVELWGADVDGRIVSAGRIDPVPGTPFAGIWGGATLSAYRGRGIYRAVTAARAQSAMRHGVAWIHSDSTEFSRPILERAGMTKVTETVPWTWERTPV